EDDAYNRGLPTEVLAVDRPDRVPPQPPAVGAIKAEAETAVVNWRASASDDVVQYILLRREEEAGFSAWTELVTLPADQTSFTDEEVVIGKSYEYSMKAVDDSDNVSRQGNVQSVKIPFPAEEVAVTAFSATASQNQANPANTLSWAYTPPERDLRGGDYEFVIYRGSGARALQEIAKVPAGTLTYTDTNIYSSVLYNYAVRVRFANGWQGAMSPVKSILSK
ncbi:MAG: fibronectin type III domain-containing protein, partial [Bacteroidota bacterium]